MNMYQKREERKEKLIENNDVQGGFNKSVINWYPGHMAKAKRLIKEKMNVIDIVFEVIDARMPYSSKIKDIDVYIGNKSKIIIMTKTDLCDLKETKKWIHYYEEKGYKVISLNLEENKNISKEIETATRELMQKMDAKRVEKGMTLRKARILIVGIPNVGKSTLINRLVGKKATKVGNKPGVTKSLDWIRIGEYLELLDSPGILWPKLEETKVAYNLASLTAIKEDILPIFDVVVYILNMLVNYYPEIAKERYDIREVDEEIIPTLDYIGRKRGCLIRGGEIDYEKVYSVVLSDIKNGFIKGITFDRRDDYAA